MVCLMPRAIKMISPQDFISYLTVGFTCNFRDSFFINSSSWLGESHYYTAHMKKSSLLIRIRDDAQENKVVFACIYKLMNIIGFD